jgi:NifB/MoaA-like Fe-S oxidoreductase
MRVALVMVLVSLGLFGCGQEPPPQIPENQTPIEAEQAREELKGAEVILRKFYNENQTYLLEPAPAGLKTLQKELAQAEIETKIVASLDRIEEVNVLYLVAQDAEPNSLTLAIYPQSGSQLFQLNLNETNAEYQPY